MQLQSTRPQTAIYSQSDIVLYRDARKYWLGEAGHTFVCRVYRVWRGNATDKILYDLVNLASGRELANIDPDYMRLLSPADTMADIDAAPLNEAHTDVLSPAAAAWLRLQIAGPSSTLPDLR
ncbi:hypothetical protein [Streptomyces sp. 769]|uniref:hypothetical protein n=1 Tax=Streptomyces sp. 769 TaxID=1262452 RepID=UPI000581C53C|nr:hypothetical protein [Streptomyces sp. 769]AJC62036.1 hypothetical protein GZL_p00106 [Streptomyces sp. 769]